MEPVTTPPPLRSEPAEPTLRPLWLRWLVLVVLALGLSAFAWWPILAAYPATQNGDGQYFHRIVEAARVSVLRYHELPMWNPFECGGVPMWDNPQSITAAPLAWLGLLVTGNVTRTMELWYVLHSAIGFVCMWLFARHDLRLTRLAAFASSTLWAFSGFHQHHYSGGHAAFVAFLYLPLAFLLWRRAETDVRMAIGLGLLFAWMIFEGAVYPLPHVAVLLAAEALTRAWPRRRLLAILKAGAIVSAVALTVGATRFLPVADQLHTHTRSIGEEGDHLLWTTLKDMFLSRDHGRFVVGQQYVWTEYASYVGPICLGLALLGVLLAGLEYAWMAALLVLSALLMCGHFSHWAPWAILKGHVFPFKEMRVPSRFLIEVTFFLVSFAGIAVDRLALRLSRWVRRPEWTLAIRHAAVAMAIVAAGDVIGVGIDTFPPFFTSSPEVSVTPSVRLFFGGSDQAGYLDQPRQNRGRLDCWDEWGFGAGAPLWQGDVPQARAATDAVKVEVANRTQNTFTLDIDAKAPGRVLVNSTFDRGWRPDFGKALEVDRQLAIDVPEAGRRRIHVKYWPRTMNAALLLTVAGVGFVVYFFVRDRRRRRGPSIAPA
jgi:hypothetical protein